MRHLFSLSAALLAGLTASHAAKADELKIVTSIAPLHSLITQVTGDLADVSFLVKGAESPHSFSLKPSDRLQLAEADFIFLIDGQFEMSLAKAAKGDDRFISYTSTPDLRLLPYRHQDDFMMASAADDDHNEHGHHDHGHDEHGHKDHHDDHGHDEHGHDEHGHDEHGHKDHHDEHGHDEHGHHEHGHDDHDEHDHGNSPHDLHIWLDPENAKAMLAYTAQILGVGDPANAAIYTANATAAIADITRWNTLLSEDLHDAHETGFVTYHDAFQYLELAYDLHVIGTILDGHATQATAATLAQLQHVIETGQVSCVFQEPQFEALSLAALDSHDAVVTAKLDPLGSDLTPGPQLYQQLITGMVDEIAHCSEEGHHHH